jgi:hypothetical protein
VFFFLSIALVSARERSQKTQEKQRASFSEEQKGKVVDTFQI